jgi:hypothetical protein
MLIGEVEQALWKVARRIAPKLPPERLRELEQAVLRLCAYVGELKFQKARVDKAWAELEAQ